MRTKALLTAILALILTVLACGLSRTPTPEPGALETAVAQTVWAELATSEPTDTPPPAATDTLTPSPLPGVTETSPPAATDTPTPSPLPNPTDTPVPPATTIVLTDTPIPTPTETPAPCAIVIAPEFGPWLIPYSEILFALGCPTGELRWTGAPEEPFQHGRMFWQQDTDLIHILYDDGTYQVAEDMYIEGDPEDACPEVGDAPAGLFKPVRGFNWQWCNTTGVRDALGWALQEEMGYGAMWLEFEHGHVLQSHANHVFIFYDDGSWDYIE